MISIRAAFIFLSILVFAPTLAWACKCPQRSEFDIQFEGKVLFHVLGEDRADGLSAVQFLVENPIKGVTTKEIKIYSPSVNACGMSFKDGAHYIVFADNSALPKTLPCWGTKEISTSETKKSDKYYLDVALVSDSEKGKPEYVFVLAQGFVGHSVFKTLEGLKNFLSYREAGTEVEMAPGCLRRGDEPLISSPKEMESFKAFMKEKGLKFMVLPSG